MSFSFSLMSQLLVSSVVIFQLDLVHGCMCNKGMYHMEVLYCCGLCIYFWQPEMICAGTPTVVMEHASNGVRLATVDPPCSSICQRAGQYRTRLLNFNYKMLV